MAILRVLLFSAPSPVSPSRNRRAVYVSVLDGDATPSTISPPTSRSEGGKARTILRAEPALAKMQIAIIVDDNGASLFRVWSRASSRPRRAEFSISTVTGQTLKLVDYTTSNGAVGRGAQARRATRDQRRQPAPRRHYQTSSTSRAAGPRARSSSR
jgi:hypothetical protein